MLIINIISHSPTSFYSKLISLRISVRRCRQNYSRHHLKSTHETSPENWISQNKYVSTLELNLYYINIYFITIVIQFTFDCREILRAQKELTFLYTDIIYFLQKLFLRLRINFWTGKSPCYEKDISQFKLLILLTF